MTPHEIVSQKELLVARKALLMKEKELTKKKMIKIGGFRLEENLSLQLLYCNALAFPMDLQFPKKGVLIQ